MQKNHTNLRNFVLKFVHKICEKFLHEFRKDMGKSISIIDIIDLPV